MEREPERNAIEILAAKVGYRTAIRPTIYLCRELRPAGSGNMHEPMLQIPSVAI